MLTAASHKAQPNVCLIQCNVKKAHCIQTFRLNQKQNQEYCLDQGKAIFERWRSELHERDYQGSALVDRAGVPPPERKLTMLAWLPIHASVVSLCLVSSQC